jgi:chromosome segregation ATPase
MPPKKHNGEPTIQRQLETLQNRMVQLEKYLNPEDRVNGIDSFVKMHTETYKALMDDLGKKTSKMEVTMTAKMEVMMEGMKASAATASAMVFERLGVLEDARALFNAELAKAQDYLAALPSHHEKVSSLLKDGLERLQSLTDEVEDVPKQMEAFTRRIGGITKRIDDLEKSQKSSREMEVNKSRRGRASSPRCSMGQDTLPVQSALREEMHNFALSISKGHVDEDPQHDHLPEDEKRHKAAQHAAEMLRGNPWVAATRSRSTSRAPSIGPREVQATLVPFYGGPLEVQVNMAPCIQMAPLAVQSIMMPPYLPNTSAGFIFNTQADAASSNAPRDGFFE